MDETPTPHHSTAQEVGGKALAAVVGATVAGPAGAVAAVALEPVFIDLVARSWEELNALRRRSAGLMMQEASREFGGQPDAVADAALAQRETAQLLADALQAALTTSNERKVTALGRAVANGLKDDGARVDEERLVVAALAGLEESHVRVLMHLPDERSRPTSTPTSSATGSAGRRGSRLTDVASRAGLTMEAATHVMAELIRTGVASRDSYAAERRHDRLILDLQEEIHRLQWQLANPGKKAQGNRRSKTLGKPGPPVEPGYSRTRFGTICLAYLDEEPHRPEGPDVREEEDPER